MTPRRLVLSLCVLLAAALGLAACGSGSSGSGSSPQDVLRATFGPNRPVKSGRLDLGLSLDAKGLQGVTGPVALRLTGPFASGKDARLPTFDLTLGVLAGAQRYDAGAVSTGDKGFVRFQGQAYALSPALFQQFKDGFAKASAQSGAKGSTTFKALGIDPLRWLKDPQGRGDEDVAGTPTRHVAAQVDVGKFLDDVNVLLGKADSIGVAGSTAAKVPSRLTAQQIATIKGAVRSASFDVWSGKDDKTLRRMVIKVAFDVPPAARASAKGLQSGTLTLNLAIAGLNQPQTVRAPASSRPLSELTSALSALTGGATGGTTAPSTTTPGTTTPPAATTPPASGSGAPSSSKYLDCLSAAGDDIAKVQRCASLLGQ